MTFNLIDEPWIRARFIDGTLEEVSLRRLFREAESIERICGELPSQDAAILRVLLAILTRALNAPETIDEWVGAWTDRPGTLAAVDEYLTAHHARFDVRDPVAPFFQVAGGTTSNGAPATLDVIIADIPNGKKFFTTRIGAGAEWLSWAEASRWLIHAHAFDPSGIRSGAIGDPRVKGGKGYPQGTGWAGQLGLVIIEGANLLETLLQNLVVPEEGNSIELPALDSDLPPWECAPLGPGVDDVEGRPPQGPVDCYTWQSRRIRLVGDDDRVTGVFLCQGDRLSPQNRTTLEPMTPWRFSDPQTKKLGVPVLMPRKHQADRAFWRGITGVLCEDFTPAKGKDIPRWRMPANIEFQRRLMATRAIAQRHLLTVRAVGVSYGSQESTIEEIVDDVLVIPQDLLDPSIPELAVVVKNAIEAADHVAFQLQNLASNVVRAQGNDMVEGPRSAAAVQFYAALDRPFREWIAGLQGGGSGALRTWEFTAREIAETQAAMILGTASPSAFKGRKNGENHLDAGLAEVWFRAGLRKAIPLAFADMAEETNSKEDK